MKKHLYRVYDLKDEVIVLIMACQEADSMEGYHGLRSDKRGKTYALISATWYEVIKAKLSVLRHNLIHRNKNRLRIKRHKGDYI